MRPAVLLCVVLALGGCSSRVQDAEDRYEIVRRGGDHKAICPAARAVRDAALQAKDEAAYADWRLRADIECAAADRADKGRASDLSAGMDAIADNMSAE